MAAVTSDGELPLEVAEDEGLEELLRERRCLLQGREEFQVLGGGGGPRDGPGLVFFGGGRGGSWADPK